MPRARKHLVCLNETPYYHVVSRCVRRAFLCGIDAVSGQNYEHRRDWIETRMRLLASIFSVDVCAYAVMSNHYHLVVKLCPDQIEDWSDDEVLSRWTTLFRGPLIVQQYRSGQTLSEAEHATLRSIVTVYRQRLGSLSWFMKCLNEPIARKANAEDHCTGHFWEARFYSQALLSEKALLATMAYVDLNPIRAEMAKTPEKSDFTSIKARIHEKTNNKPSVEVTNLIRELVERGEVRHFGGPIRPLLGFANPASHAPGREPLPMYEHEYFKLVDLTARVLVHGKSGRTDPNIAPILERLGLSKDQWINVSTGVVYNDRIENLRSKSEG